MSESLRPSVPRPASRTSAPPPPVPSSGTSLIVPANARERFATLDLEDDDILGIAVAPIAVAPPSSARAVSMPPPPPSVRPSAPPAPVSYIAPKMHAAPVAFVPPPAPVPTFAPVTRLTISDPTDVLFESMHGLAFARSAGEAAEICAETLATALGARAVVIHRHDLKSRELRAIGAHGDGDFEIIGSAEASEDDLVASAVICNQRSVTMTFDGELSQLAPKRLHHVGVP